MLKYKELPIKSYTAQGNVTAALKRLTRKAIFERTPTKHCKVAKIQS
jgi:hypothetical protein